MKACPVELARRKEVPFQAAAGKATELPVDGFGSVALWYTDTGPPDIASMRSTAPHPAVLTAWFATGVEAEQVAETHDW